MKRGLVRVLLRAGLIAVVLLPVSVSMAIAYRLALHEQQQRTSIIASEVLHRAHAISGQIAHARSILEHSSASPCSPSGVAMMRNLTLSSSYLQLVGYVEGNRLICSSYGNHGDGIPVGPADYLSKRGAWIRRSVYLPFLPKTRFFMVTEQGSGYSSLALPDLILDAGRESREISVALVAISTRSVILARGQADVRQLPAFHQELGEMQWVGDEQVGTIRFSASNDYAAIASVPVSAVRRSWLSIARFAAPLGGVVGTLIAVLLIAMLRQRAGMLAQLDRAIRRREFSLAYMPIVELDSGRWVGAEALLRWRRPGGDLAGPEQFIPIAEQHHRMKRLTDRMLDILVVDSRESLARHAGQRYVSINLSAQDLSDTAIVEKLRQTREESGLPRLMVEATEGGLLNVDRANSIIQRLGELDISVAIDDFGIGYSSLSYLGTLRAAYLKIDKSFVSAIGSDGATRHVIDHIIAMARDCDLTVIAEGVESEEQAAYLRDAGVRYAQGWLFGRPMTASELVARGWRDALPAQVV
jgi:sensor c-di-GMP phosphodiesterase-like protein